MIIKGSAIEAPDFYKNFWFLKSILTKRLYLANQQLNNV